jgi:acylglycerol lipase
MVGSTDLIIDLVLKYGLSHIMYFQGHGQSDGEPRGFADKLDHFVGDLEEYIDLVNTKNYTDKGQTAPPLILMGQSMGGLLSLLTTLHMGNDRVAGIILTAPALGVNMSLELKVQKFFAPVINTIAPKARIVDAVDPWDMSRNKEAVQQYIDDPLTQTGKLVARTAIGMSGGFEVIKQRRGEITVPILALHGTGDKCTWPKATEEFFHGVGTPVAKKRYLKLPGMYHELLEEPETEKILEYIVAFASSGGEEFAKVDGTESGGVVDVVFK